MDLHRPQAAKQQLFEVSTCGTIEKDRISNVLFSFTLKSKQRTIRSLKNILLCVGKRYGY